MKLLKSLYLNNLFFYGLLFTGAMFFVAFFLNWLYVVVNWLLIIFLLIGITDIFLLYLVKTGVQAVRVLPDKLSNGDDNIVSIELTNNYPFTIGVAIIDEIPFQFQKRDFRLSSKLKQTETKNYQYELRPTSRGQYQFGKLNIYVTSPLKLAQRRYTFSNDVIVSCYPSYIQLRKYDLLASSNQLYEYGLKRIRRIGHTMEFEQIKDYVQGDDYRTINWKATSKKSSLMVNQFQEEKSQPVYQIIDTGRSMFMPFRGLSLLDYSINSALALSNIVLRKNDKAGMFTFSKKLENYVVADKKTGQLQKILNTLYHIETDFKESDFSRLYVDIRKNITQRSLLMLYTNFETMDSLRRQQNYIKEIAKNHLLVIVFFENTELNSIINSRAKNTKEIYDKIIAEKFDFEKRLIVRELKSQGVQTIFTQPENLTIDTINKYIELKSRGMI